MFPINSFPNIELNQLYFQLTNVVPGRFIFKLTVTDDQGLTSTDTVSIIVHPDPLVLNLVELTLSMGISVLTQSELDSLVQKISLLLGDVKVRVRDLRTEPKTGDAIIIFYVDRVVSINCLVAERLIMIKIKKLVYKHLTIII